MAEIIPESIHRYAEQHTTIHSALLKKIERETNLETEQPHMLSGPVQGRFLSLMARLLKPSRILEIGTFTGYSALCLAEGLEPGGVLHTIDCNDELVQRCQGYFREAGRENQIHLHTGDALTVIPGLAGPFDLVFIDADKPNYSRYFDLVIDKLRPGGLILADNVFYHGEVLEEADQQSKNGKAIAAFNHKVKQDDRVIPLMVPLRDGLYIIQKKETK